MQLITGDLTLLISTLCFLHLHGIILKIVINFVSLLQFMITVLNNPSIAQYGKKKLGNYIDYDVYYQ